MLFGTFVALYIGIGSIIGVIIMSTAVSDDDDNNPNKKQTGILDFIVGVALCALLWPYVACVIFGIVS